MNKQQTLPLLRLKLSEDCPQHKICELDEQKQPKLIRLAETNREGYRYVSGTVCKMAISEFLQRETVPKNSPRRKEMDVLLFGLSEAIDRGEVDTITFEHDTFSLTLSLSRLV